MPVPQPEEAIELAHELKLARIKVAELESRWAAFFNVTVTSPVVPVALKPRIVHLLESQPSQSFTVQDVASALSANENSVGPYLSDLAREGRIEKRGRGWYGASIDIAEILERAASELGSPKEESPVHQ